jgi:hypothetical protein
MPDSAIVVVAIGVESLAYWKTYCEQQCRAYAAKCGYDLILITEPLDNSRRAAGRSPAWQKCLVLSQGFSQNYRQIISLDSDIVINAAVAPRITDQAPPDRVGGVISGSHIHEDLRCILSDRLQGTTAEYVRGLKNWDALQRLAYVHYGLQPLTSVVQTGVLVASPIHHRSIFEAIYHAPERHVSRCYEQIPLSHALLTADLFCRIDSRFNSVFYETALVHYPYLRDSQIPHYDWAATYAVQTEFANNFFLHFAYDRTLVRYLPQDLLAVKA